MLKSIRRLANWLAAPSDIGPSSDLLAHPLIERMSERELADLPLPQDRDREAGHACCPA